VAIHTRSTLAFPRHIALPSDHGSWVFLLSPLLIGLFAGADISGWGPASAFLILACLAAFLLRQPVTILVKIHSGRRDRRDLTAAWYWAGIYSLAGGLALAGLIWQGYSYLMILALPGIPVFAWHLFLVSRRAERRQLGVELVGSGALALAAPAGYWIGAGRAAPVGWLLFGLVWLQSAASIVYAYLRLDQRQLRAVPAISERLRMARRPLLYAGFNLALAILLSFFLVAPPLVPLPFAFQFAETGWGSLIPAVGIRPTRIGWRQLIISSLFTLLFILAWI
jgi:hypothetical protein